jgi:hypothetical protein
MPRASSISQILSMLKATFMFVARVFSKVIIYFQGVITSHSICIEENTCHKKK